MIRIVIQGKKRNAFHGEKKKIETKSEVRTGKGRKAHENTSKVFMKIQ